MGKEFRIKGNSLQMIETVEMDIKRIAEILQYLRENKIIEFGSYDENGQEIPVNGIKSKELWTLTHFGLVSEVDDVWHLSFKLDGDSEEILSMLNREFDLEKILDDKK